MAEAPSHHYPTAPLALPAQPEKTGERAIGVLLVHGFTGSPASLKPWAQALGDQGYAVEVPLLPGHGTRWQDLNRVAWTEWYAESEAAFDRLRESCEAVVVGGLSMGGSLALRLAEERGDQVSGVVLVNPFVSSTRKELVALPLMKLVIPSLRGIVNDIKKPGQDERGYDRVPLKALDSMLHGWKGLRRELPEVTQPILLFRSAEDHVVDPSSAAIIAREVSSRQVEERILENSYHVATLDNDAPAIFEESLDFVRRVTGP